MSDVILFGGTTEGRLLAEYCATHGINTVVCVVSEYGQKVLPDSPCLKVIEKAMTCEEMSGLIRTESPQMVLDATHPYAAVVTENIAAACRETGAAYIRISREGGEKPDGRNPQTVLWVDSVQEAAEYLKTVEGPVLVTTGSKELEAYTVLPGYEERLYVRVLPGSENLKICESMGIMGNHIIGMQGPFSKEMNTAMLRYTKARYLVTKEAGTAGGFQEKIQAALECGVTPIVIGRPVKPRGISLEEGMIRLQSLIKERSICLNLIGIGMGGQGQLTLEAADILRESDAVLGAPRMLLSVGAFISGAVKEPCYLSADICDWLESHHAYKKVSVVYSGDTGFYSGAKTLIEELKERGHKAPGNQPQIHIQVYPGISTVSYLCSRLLLPWDDVYLASAHGREQDITELMREHQKIFLLLGGENSVKELCCKLVKAGYGGSCVSVGERLSYPDERIVTGTAAMLSQGQFASLSAVLLQRMDEDTEEK